MNTLAHPEQPTTFSDLSAMADGKVSFGTLGIVISLMGDHCHIDPKPEIVDPGGKEADGREQVITATGVEEGCAH